LSLLRLLNFQSKVVHLILWQSWVFVFHRGVSNAQ